MATPNALIADAEGLQTQPNELTLPVGSLSVAENVEITRDGVIEVARGFEDFSENLPDFTPEQLLVIGGVVYANVDDGLWYHDGTRWLRKRGSEVASFYSPHMFWISSSDVMYLTDEGNHVIYAIDLTTGRKSVLAGRVGATGSTNGTGDAARFSSPRGIWGDNAGNLYVADGANHQIRLVTTAGVVTLLAGSTSGNTDGSGAAAQFNDPDGIFGVDSNIYVCDRDNGSIRICSTSGVVTTLASGLSGPIGVWGEAGVLYVTSVGDDTVKTVTYPGGTIATLASGLASPRGIVGSDGTLYVIDLAAVKTVTYPGGTVATLAGSNAAQGTDDGIGTAARFELPVGIGLYNGALIVADADNADLRRVYLGTGYTVRLAGRGIVIGTDARSNSGLNSFVSGPS